MVDHLKTELARREVGLEQGEISGHCIKPEEGD